MREKRDAYGSMVEEREVRYEKFQHFIDSRYIKTDTCYDSDLLEVSDPGFDCYICVTDVIWKYEPGEGFDRGFFLASKAMEGKTKIAYAASRGVVPTYSSEQKTKFFHYINDIDFISVREKSLKEFIESYSKKNAELVLDPVLLQDRNFYDSIAVTPSEKDYVVVYYVVERANDTLRMAIDYARAHNLTVVELADWPDSSRLDEFDDVDKVFRYDIGIEEWLGYIRGAKRVFTNSFHGTCLSILFEKRFFVGKRNGDKIDNLLEETGLSSRRVKNLDEIEQLGDPDINFAPVNAKLQALRKSSTAFILNAIQQCKEMTDKGVKQSSLQSYDFWRRNLSYPIIYHSGGKPSHVDTEAFKIGKIEKPELLASGNIQFRSSTEMTNDGTAALAHCGFACKQKQFRGWRLRIRIDKRWFWVLEDGLLIPKAEGAYKAATFAAGTCIPHIPVNNISTMVAEAVWESDSYTVHFNSGITSLKGKSRFSRITGTTKLLKSGSIEYTPRSPFENSGEERLPRNRFKYRGKKFVGWKVRIKERGIWYWFLEDGSFVPQKSYSKNCDGERMLLEDQAVIPKFTAHDVATVVFEASWEE